MCLQENVSNQYSALISETWGMIDDVSVRASNVVRRYLLSLLMDGHATTKTELAGKMKTSRARLNAAFSKGTLTNENIEGLANLAGGDVSRVFRALATIADRMEKGSAPSALSEEEEEFLRGRADKIKFSGGPPSSSADALDDEPSEPSLPSKRPRQPPAQNPKHED